MKNMQLIASKGLMTSIQGPLPLRMQVSTASANGKESFNHTVV